MKRRSSHVQIILPEDIQYRIAEFIQGKQIFPFIKHDELMCILFLYLMCEDAEGRERNKVVDMATKTVKKINFEINGYINSPRALDSDMIRDLYLKRQLQITVEQAESTNFRTDMIMNDPSILSYCFSQHISHYRQDYFFQMYGPLREGEFLNEMRTFLQGTMIMLGFNRKNEIALPFKHPIMPLYIWLRDHQIR